MINKKKPERKPVDLGLFVVGWEQVRVFLRGGTGGEFIACPTDSDCPTISIGVEGQSWQDVHTVAMHEILEFCFFRRNTRYSPTHIANHARSHASYLFVMTHEEFHAAIADASEMMVALGPKLVDAYKKWVKK